MDSCTWAEWVVDKHSSTYQTGWSCDSVASTQTILWAVQSEVQFPVETRDFSLHQNKHWGPASPLFNG